MATENRRCQKNIKPPGSQHGEEKGLSFTSGQQDRKEPTRDAWDGQ